jgi:hypothetical protein
MVGSSMYGVPRPFVENAILTPSLVRAYWVVLSITA